MRSSRELSAILELDASYEDFCGIWSSIFLPDTLIQEDLLAALRERYRLLLLSNTNAIHFEMVRRTYPLLDRFHHHVVSYKVGALKPSPVIYAEAIKHAECDPPSAFSPTISLRMSKARGRRESMQFSSKVRPRSSGNCGQRGVDW